MAKRIPLATTLALCLLLACEGDQGPTGVQGAQGPSGSEADLTAFATTDGTPPNEAGDANQLHWNRLTGVPSGFSDGVDDVGDPGTTYTAGDGISISGTVISLLWGGNGSATTATRSDHIHDTRYTTTVTLSSTDGDGPNSGSNLVHWDRLTGMPAGFADGVDDGGISDGSVTTAKLADAAITEPKIADGAVTSNKIAGASINGSHIVNNSLNGGHMVDNSLTAAQLASNAVQIDIENVFAADLIMGANSGVITTVTCSSGYTATSGMWEGGASVDRDVTVINSTRTIAGTGWNFWFWNHASSDRSITPGVACIRLVM